MKRHTLVFLLFQEPIGGINVPIEAVERKGDLNMRPKWNAMAFAERYNLRLVGANFFLTEHGKLWREDSAPVKELGRSLSNCRRRRRLIHLEVRVMVFKINIEIEYPL